MRLGLLYNIVYLVCQLVTLFDKDFYQSTVQPEMKGFTADPNRFQELNEAVENLLKCTRPHKEPCRDTHKARNVTRLSATIVVRQRPCGVVYQLQSSVITFCGQSRAEWVLPICYVGVLWSGDQRSVRGRIKRQSRLQMPEWRQVGSKSISAWCADASWDVGHATSSWKVSLMTMEILASSQDIDLLQIPH